MKNPRGTGDDGAALVEFALVLPVFALLLFAVIQFGLVFAGGDELRTSVQSAARMISAGAFQDGSTSCKGVAGLPLAEQQDVCGAESVVTQPLGATGPVQMAIVVSVAVSGSPPAVIVCARAPVELFAGFSASEMSAVSELYLEQPPAKGFEFNPDALGDCPPVVAASAGARS